MKAEAIRPRASGVWRAICRLRLSHAAATPRLAKAAAMART
jgi:hypothetical protein